ncbi:type I 3-dehydroquinate dehydratase [Candidatus Micrarchaeota archaeon]|nr:type I 3-dehydroquinate dehydratase [Candidatus Micrarchaeota archaeon]
MICASIGESSIEDCISALGKVGFAEVRLDSISGIGVGDVRRIFSLSSSGKKLIATCRKEACAGCGIAQDGGSAGSGRGAHDCAGGRSAGKILDDSLRKELLLAAIDSGAAYVDLEVEMAEGMRKEIADRAKERGCKLIVSFHDFSGTPKREELGKIVERCFSCGADVAKIACMVDSQQDNARLLGLLGEWKGLIVIGMGKKGRSTRVLAPLLGAEFTFASLGGKTAPGQMELGKMREIIERIEDELETD